MGKERGRLKEKLGILWQVIRADKIMSLIFYI
jgi:hypothetical protein